MSRESKERQPVTIELNKTTELFLNDRREKLDRSASNCVNELLLFAMRIRKQLRDCPNSYLAINVDESEVNVIHTEILK